MTLVKIESLTPESLVAIKERQMELKQLVKENSYIECKQENHEEARRRRTALRKGRTNIQNEVKMICSKLAGVSRGIKDAGDQLIMIVQKAEDKQQDSVAAFEEEKERIRQEKIRLEQERKDKLKEEIVSWMGEMNDRIGQAQTSKDLEKLRNKILLVQVSGEAKQEFPSDIAWAKTQLELRFNNRVAQIELQVEQENLFLLRKKNEALERKAEKERLEREAERGKIQMEKEELEQQLIEAKQELINKVVAEKQEQEQSEPVEEPIPEPEPVQENQEEEEVPNAELIKVWSVEVKNGNHYTERDPDEILAYLEEMEKGSQLYIGCDFITFAEYELLNEFVGS